MAFDARFASTRRLAPSPARSGHSALDVGIFLSAWPGCALALELNDTGRIAKLPHEVLTPPCTTTGVGGLNGMRRGERFQTRLDGMTMLTLTW